MTSDQMQMCVPVLFSLSFHSSDFETHFRHKYFVSMCLLQCKLCLFLHICTVPFGSISTSCLMYLYLFLTQGLTEFVVNQVASQASQRALGILPPVPCLTTPSTGDTDAFCTCGGALNSGPHVYRLASYFAELESLPQTLEFSLLNVTVSGRIILNNGNSLLVSI